MGLQWMAEKTPDLCHLNPMVKVCLKEIGEIVYMGVAFRKMASSAHVSLRVERESRDCHCLGLVVEHLAKDSMGLVKKVWSFAHVSLQEFVNSFWLSVCSWGDQCASVRYIVHSNESFNLFPMILRFLCGLLSSNAFSVLYILYKHLPTTPVPIVDMPKLYQLNYNDSVLYSIMGWTEYTRNYLAVTTLLFESCSDSICDCFSCFKKFLPQSSFFYFKDSTPPNEWECFVRSLPLLHSVQLVYIDTQHFTLSQFRLLIATLTSCSLRCLAIKLYRQDYSTLMKYSSVIREYQLSPDSKISLEISMCGLSETESADYLSHASIFQLYSSLILNFNELTPYLIEQIANRLNNIDYLHINPRSIPNEQETLLPYLYNNTRLTGLHLVDIPTKSVKLLQTLLPKLSNLREIALHSESENPYSLLPYMGLLSSIKYLELSPDEEPTYTGHKYYLIRLLNASSHSLRRVELRFVHSIGLNSCEELFLTLSSCTNLVEIQLYKTNLHQEDVTLLDTAVSGLRSLLYLDLYEVPLSESVIFNLCRGLLCHSSIRHLYLYYCELNSNYCAFLIQLIPTLSQFNTLYMLGNNLSEPNPDSVKILKQAASKYSIDCSLLN